VNTASAAGLAPMGGASGYLYDASKAGVIGLSEALCKQLAHEGHPIGVTVLCPGPVASNMIATGRSARSTMDAPGSPADERHTDEQEHSLRRLGMTPDEVGLMVVEGIRANRLYVLSDRTMASALASLYTGRKVRTDTAMTGEITLSGQVFPVGGIKEKVLAAHRAGIRRIILPAQNESDTEEIPADVRAELEIIPAKLVSDVLNAGLEKEVTERPLSNGFVPSPEAPTEGSADRLIAHKAE
jgi:hypothetical protein